MEKPGFIVKFYDKTFEGKTIEELVNAPVAAISGVSEADAIDLKKAFGIQTVEDLATNRYVRIAQGLNCFSQCSGEVLDKCFESEEYVNLTKEPVAAISGVSKEDAALLKKAFGIDNIKELAENKYVVIAQTTVALARMSEFLKAIL